MFQLEIGNKFGVWKVSSLDLGNIVHILLIFFYHFFLFLMFS